MCLGSQARLKTWPVERSRAIRTDVKMIFWRAPRGFVLPRGGENGQMHDRITGPPPIDRKRVDEDVRKIRQASRVMGSTNAEPGRTVFRNPNRGQLPHDL